MSKIELPHDDPALPLGKDRAYPDHYDPGLLYPIARAIGRDAIGVTHASLPFVGWDLWRCYEVSWLMPSGLPRVAMLQLRIPAESRNIVESKSLKLYLNSLNHEHFADTDTVKQRVTQDLSAVVGCAVELELIVPTDFAQQRIEEPVAPAICLDEQDLRIDCYEPNADLLALAPGQTQVTQSVFSRLLKSNCPVTGQPDWGTVHIDYQGPEIDRASLLRYIVSFRQHQGFHEQCVEQMFCDIMKHAQPSVLSIYARYTRRGGIDINPWRATAAAKPPKLQRSAQQ